MYKDRIDAASRLGEKLSKYRDKPGVALAIPNGGMPVGFHIAQKINYPLDVAMVEKLPHPNNKDFMIGAVGLTTKVVNNDIDIPEEYVERESRRIRERLQRQYRLLCGNRAPADVRGKVVVIADDGAAAGSSIMAVVELLKAQDPEKIVVAIPVAPAKKLGKLRDKADEIICLQAPEASSSVADFYQRFTRVTEEEAVKLIRFSKLLGSGR